jgi:hypothetical protein
MTLTNSTKLIVRKSPSKIRLDYQIALKFVKVLTLMIQHSIAAQATKFLL